MPTKIKKILIISIAILIILLCTWVGLRPWWLGFEVIRGTGSLQDISFVERPMCKYWQGELKIEEPNRPAESLRVWIEPTHPEQDNLVEKLQRVAKTGERVEVQYQKTRAKRFWACTPSDYKLISIELVPSAPNPVLVAPSAPATPVPSAAVPPASPPVVSTVP